MKFAAVFCVLIALFGRSLVALPYRCTRLPASEGYGAYICLQIVSRWTYCYRENVCKLFYYGGCGGNINNFRTLGECERTCVQRGAGR
ncbi:PREDICTED: kunitz-type serine protease inhibitor-like [Drosophila arizonae]|uniref:Kunitz-type serine protease inhibitor-like n=1 Tax=Drosophila arizonae TaxID=7263 RepID=A0ABM1NSJ2_DROAR|nr:PREDICTED: kunitz-type serine protease inhibitor-like [Drosophila arizonae]